MWQFSSYNSKKKRNGWGRDEDYSLIYKAFVGGIFRRFKPVILFPEKETRILDIKYSSSVGKALKF